MLQLTLLIFCVFFNNVKSEPLQDWHHMTRHYDYIISDSSLESNHEPAPSEDVNSKRDEYDDGTRVYDEQETTTNYQDFDSTPTTEKTIYTTTPSENFDSTTDTAGRICPKGQSSFTIEDLIVMIDHVAETELNITVSINNSYHDSAIQARDKLFQVFNDFKAKFMERPEHLNHVLDDIDNSLKNTVAPLARKANASLQEFPVVERVYNRLNNKTTRILKDLENYKNICKWNCKQQYRFHSAPPQSSTYEELNKVSEDPTPNNHGDLCSTIEKVYKTIFERLTTFEQEEKEKLQKQLIDNGDILKQTIEQLKKQLKDAAVSEFGTTMYDILSLFDDYFHSVEDLKDFNKQSFITDIKKSNINAELNFVELDIKIKSYRERCLKCSLTLRHQAGFAEREGEPIETQSDKNDTAILDQLIENKINEIRKTVNADIESIFMELNDTLNDKDLVEKTIGNLKPIQESVKIRVQKQGQTLRELMNIIPMELKEKVKKLRQDSQALLTKLTNTIAAVVKRN